MKNTISNRLLILLITLIVSNTCVFAKEDTVISDSATKKQISNSFDDVNQYTNNFFTPYVKKEVKKGVEDPSLPHKLQPVTQNHGSLAPVKKLRLMYQNRNLPKTAATEIEETATKDQAILDCDSMEYFATRTELEANGHVVMFFPQNNSTLKADKVVYNQTSNLIKAYGNVVLISDGKEMFGDYMFIDMNEENAFLNNPASDLFQIRARAKKGYMYGDKIIQEQGSFYVSKKMMIDMKSEMFGPNLDTMYVAPEDKSAYMKDSHGSKFKIKTNDLIINSKKEHETVTLKHAEIYFNDKKIGTVPTITMHTNKAQDYVEANFPELGTLTNMGFYAGPGFVFDTPRGSTLKVVPVVNPQSDAENPDNNKLGFGAVVKFKSATNQTDTMYGTANNVFIMRGKQKLDDNLYFQYGSNAYMEDWFMGFRMPKLMGELVYQDTNIYSNFIGKGKPMSFSQRLAAAYVQDASGDGPLISDPAGIGTMRFKYMAEAAQTLWSYKDALTSPINAALDIVGQGSTAVYGTGDTQLVARVGPRLHTQYNWWMQDVGYFLSAYDDHTPLLLYDRYMYGRSNVYMRESFRLCKYLTLSWFGSLNLMQDSWDGKMLQENGFYFSVGPDDVKLNIGYDTVRQQSFITMAMHIDAKGSTLEYKKMVIKNPERLGKDKDGNSSQPQQSFLPASDSDNIDTLERAEVTNIVQEAL